MELSVSRFNERRLDARLRERMNDDKLPLTLVAFEFDNFIGTALLFVSDMEDRPELTPWLAAVFVKEEIYEITI